MNNTQQYFNLHTSGVGRLTRARKIEPARGKPYLAVDIMSQQGGESTQCFSANAVGEPAIAALNEALWQINSGQYPKVRFNLGDLLPTLFTYKQGEKQGQTGLSLKSRLLNLKINPKESCEEHTRGVGFINNIKETEAGWLVRLCAVHGRTDNLERVYFNCLLDPDQAPIWLTPIQQGLAEKKTLFAAFNLGPMSYDQFVFKNGKRAGEEGFVMIAPLTEFFWINSAGSRVYTRPEKVEVAPKDDTQDERPVIVRKERSTFAALI